ncbi:hypothetical protein L7F22_052508 [Adiantum nelumboides]|nr:hypothetical protein [Adiantum nelumboides]
MCPSRLAMGSSSRCRDGGAADAARGAATTAREAPAGAAGELQQVPQRSSSQQALDAVEREVAGLAECCDRITQSLNSCSATTGDIVAATERLKHDLQITNQRQDIVSSFLRDYQLSPEEISALRDEELNDTFFKALAQVQEIHANCKVLLRTHHQV